MRRKKITSVLLPLLLSVSLACSPFAALPVSAEEEMPAGSGTEEDTEEAIKDEQDKKEEKEITGTSSGENENDSASDFPEDEEDSASDFPADEEVSTEGATTEVMKEEEELSEKDDVSEDIAAPGEENGSENLQDDKEVNGEAEENTSGVTDDVSEDALSEDEDTSAEDVDAEERTSEQTEETEVAEEPNDHANGNTSEEVSDVQEGINADGSESGEETVEQEVEEAEGREAALAAVDDAYSGKWGDNLTWKLTGENNSLTLTISGSGAMKDRENSESGYPWYSKKSSITRIVIGKGVTSIGESAFNESERLQSVSLPAGMKVIGESAFCCCPKLKSVRIPEGVTRIEGSAFSLCNGLSSINIPRSLKYLGAYAFNECINLKQNIVIPKGVTEIGTRTFWGCGITGVSIPSTVKTIDDEAFYMCESLKKVTIEKGVTSIGERAFQRDYELGYIDIPSSITYIGEDAFRDIKLPWYYDGDGQACKFNIDDIKAWFNIEYGGNSGITLWGDLYLNGKPLTNVTIPEGTKVIKIGSLDYKFNVKSLTIPTSVTSIQDGALCATNITKINVKDIKTWINMDFKGFNNVWYLYVNGKPCKDLVIPKDVTNIKTGPFHSCGNIKTITIQNGIKDIPEKAFMNTSVSKVIIPASVKTIGARAFSGCGKLKRIWVPRTVKKIGNGAFNNGAHKEEKEKRIVILYQGSKAQWNSATTKKHSYARKIQYKCFNVDIKTKLPKSSYSYTGKAVKPEPKVTYKGKTLKKGVDYTVSYKKNKNVGIASYIIKGKGKYSGKTEDYFLIRPKAPKIIKATQTSKGIRVTWAKQTDELSEFYIFYGKVGKGSRVAFAKNTSVSKLLKTKKKGKYYIYIKAYKYMGLNTYISSASKKVYVTVK